jgi:exosortase A-associated hydrolase 1
VNGGDGNRDVTERFVRIDCDGEQCLGILATPGEGRSTTGVVIVVGGPQTRVGSHRQFVTLARALAAARYPTLRFDYRGMGDSDGDARTFESVGTDIKAAVDTLQRETGVERVVLWGLCDGASAILIEVADDRRLSGVVLVNPWARSAASATRARLRHYYLARAFDQSMWRKLLLGRLDWRRSASEIAASAAGAAGRAAAGPTYLDRMHAGWARLEVPALIILSGRDLTAREFEAWQGADAARSRNFGRRSTTTCRLADADHTFSGSPSHGRMIEHTVAWIDTLGSD